MTKEELAPHEVRLAPVDTNPVFQCLAEENKYWRDIFINK